MLQPVRWVFLLILRGVLSLRYRITLIGQADVLKHPGPFLILPNHPAFAEPPNLIARLWPIFRMRPMLLETNFQNPVLAPFAWLLRAIRVPDTERASALARQQAEAAVATVVAGSGAVPSPQLIVAVKVLGSLAM